MRVILLDVGRRFVYRMQIYSSAFILYYGILFCVFMLTFFEVIHWHPELSTVISLGFEISLIFFLVIYVVYKGAAINNETTKQIIRIVELRTVLVRIQADWKDVI